MTLAFPILVAMAVLVPLLGAVCIAVVPAGHVSRKALRAVLVGACLPALGLAAMPVQGIGLDVLLLGMRLETGVLQQAMLLLVGFGWGLAGWFAADRVGHRLGRFCVFWLLSLAGVVLASVAGDLASFYLGYAVMTLSAYGLVVHAGGGEARLAGRVYLVMAILAEGALLAGILLLAADHGGIGLAGITGGMAGPESPQGVAGVLLLLGFSVKIGVVGLHLWLPLAHPVAPAAASAILSGVIVKAGILGLVRVMPPGALPESALPGLLGIGLATALYGVLVGLAQTRVKTVLAYSTVSQMGLLFMAAVLALFAPDRDVLLPMLGLLVLHHGLCKAALFLAAGSSPLRGPWPLALFALPALALAGLPLTSGALAKGGLKHALEGAGPGLPPVLWLSLSSVATACLLWRALVLARTGEPKASPVHPAWPALVVAGVAVPWAWAAHHRLVTLPGAGAWLDGLWPLAAAAVAVVVAGALVRRSPRLDWRGRVPEGDLLVPVLALLRGARSAAIRAWPRMQRPRWPIPAPSLELWIATGERTLGSVSAAGLSLLVLGLTLWLAWS